MFLRFFHAGVSLYRRLPFPAARRLIRRGWDRVQARRGNRVVTATVDGITYELHLNELIDSNIYFTGSFEPETTAAIRRLVVPGFVVLDIGANIGCHALRMAKLVGDRGKVFAFEPMPWARRKLEANLALNRFGNVEVVARGLSDAARLETVHFRSSWSLGATGRSSEDPASAGAHLVEFSRLDDVLAEKKLGRVDFIKLDVDGYEFKVLRGADTLLREHHPTILMELGAYTLRSVGDDIRAMVTYLVERGYRFYEETTFAEWPSTDAMIAAVPTCGTIDVIASARPLPR